VRGRACAKTGHAILQCNQVETGLDRGSHGRGLGMDGRFESIGPGRNPMAWTGGAAGLCKGAHPERTTIRRTSSYTSGLRTIPSRTAGRLDTSVLRIPSSGSCVMVASTSTSA
jgi:hypothetical protein